MIEMADDGALAAAFEKANRGIDLGTHAAWREVPLAMEGLDLLKADLCQLLLVGLAVVHGNARHRSQDEELVDTEHIGDMRRRQVLVDDGRHSGAHTPRVA